MLFGQLLTTGWANRLSGRFQHLQPCFDGFSLGTQCLVDAIQTGGFFSPSSTYLGDLLEPSLDWLELGQRRTHFLQRGIQSLFVCSVLSCGTFSLRIGHLTLYVGNATGKIIDLALQCYHFVAGLLQVSPLLFGHL